MEIVVDGKTLINDFEADSWDDFIKRICAELLKNNLGVSKISIDGQTLKSFTIEEISKFDINSVNKVEIQGANIYLTIKSILEEIMNILPETEHFHAEASRMIKEGNEKEGLKVLELILKFWQNLVQVVKTIGEVSQSKNLRLRNYEEITYEFQQLTNITKEIMDSISSGDYVTIADTIEHKLKPKVWVWKRLTEDLYNFFLDKFES